MSSQWRRARHHCGILNGCTSRGRDVQPQREESPLTADTVQNEILVEQRRVDELYAQLDWLRRRTQESLVQVRQAPVVPTPAGRAERDAFDAMHLERLRQLDAVEDRLVFGRLDLITGEGRYIGRIGMSDDEQQQLLLDWRAPAAASFYQATAASPQDVLRRRHLALRGRTVAAIDDEVLNADALAAAIEQGHSELATVAGEGALMTALNARRTGTMRDIVATLQSEQDAIVRSELAGALVVQGGPGTGKTAVALHRAAYLLYTHRDRIARSGVLVVGPTPVFLRYIEQVLPSLGETGVVMLTPGQLFPGVDAVAIDSPEVAVLKGELRMQQLIRAAIRRRQRTISEPITLNLDGDQIVLRPKVVADARSRARQSGRPHNEARNTFVRIVLDDLADQLASTRRMGDAEERSALLQELREERDVRREINLLWMPLTATRFVRDLLTKPAKLTEAAGGVLGPTQQRLLLRDPSAPWTVSDIPLLDEAAELIGADIDRLAEDAAQRRAAAAERVEALEVARKVLQDSRSEATEMLPQVTAEMLVDRFASRGSTGSPADRAATDRQWAYGHAVIDEAQELSPMQWRVIHRRVPNASMTIVGDVAQTGSPAGTNTWAEVLDPLVGGRWRLAELTVNYRTPAKVMRVATGVMRAAGIPVTPARTAREGDFEVLRIAVPSRDPDHVAAAVVKVINRDTELLDGGQIAAVVPRGAVRDLAPRVMAALSSEVAARVQILDVVEVKGLEFDSVIVVDPAAIVRGSRRGVNDLYVALTRPTQSLAVIHHQDLPPGLEETP